MSGNNSITTQNLQLKNNADSTDMVFIAYSNVSGNAVQTSVSNLFANSILYAANIISTNFTTPVNSVVPSQQGQIWFDTNYIYVAVANNVLKRCLLSSF